MSQDAIIEALSAAGPLEYGALASAVYGVYPGTAPTSTQVANTRHMVSRLRARGLVSTVPARHSARAGRPPVQVQLTAR